MIRFSKGIVENAEKYSSKSREWEYSKIFGYIWKPFGIVFQLTRPFFDANYIKLNGEIALVPNQSYNWAPKKLGSWLWSYYQGWIWIPGNQSEDKNYKGHLVNAYGPENYTLYLLENGIYGTAENNIGTNLFYYYENIYVQNTSDSLMRILNYDWNPDARLSKVTGIKLNYNPAKNEVMLTKINKNTTEVSGAQKFNFKRIVITNYNKFTGSSNYSSANNRGNSGIWRNNNSNSKYSGSKLVSVSNGNGGNRSGSGSGGRVKI